MEPGRPDERSSPAPLESLSALAYEELKAVARHYLRRERKDHTLDPTALVHEAYLRLARAPGAASLDHKGFRAIAARVMRQVLVDSVRSHVASKRGGGRQRITLSGTDCAGFAEGVDILALDEALQALAAMDERAHRIVEMRFFGGMTVEEVARALDVSKRTVESEWAMARAWLARELS